MGRAGRVRKHTALCVVRTFHEPEVTSEYKPAHYFLNSIMHSFMVL